MKIKTNLKKCAVIAGKPGGDPVLKLEFHTAFNDKMDANELQDILLSIKGQIVTLSISLENAQVEAFPAPKKVAKAK